MSTSKSAPANNGVKRQDDIDMASLDKDDKRDVKPARTLNRVPRACNACRKQKMRCEGAENPPCRRCRHAGLECLFEKPSREPTLTGEAGLERIRSLENQVADIKQGQMAIHTTLAELVQQLRASSAPPSSFPSYRQSPNLYPAASPALSTPTTIPAVPMDNMHGSASDMPSSNSYAGGHGALPPIVSPPGSRQQQRGPIPGPSLHRGASVPGPANRPSNDLHPSQVHTSGSYPPGGNYPAVPSQQGPTLPPITTLHELGSSRPGPSNVSSVRYQQGEASPHMSAGKHPPSVHASPGRRSPRRKVAGSSNVTSSNTSDVEDDDNGELPASGLVAPWEVLRGLADVAIERAARENGDSSEPHSRARSHSPDSRFSKPTKRRKTYHREVPRPLTYPDVVTKKIITEAEARELFKIFYAGCSTFLPVFDSGYDTFESLHERSPFALDCICMVAAKVRDGGGPPSETYLKCLEEVQSISCATLFSPVTRQEAVQAMVLVSGWSDNGWLSGGHAVRMAVELSMHQAWPKLMKRIEAGRAADSPEDRKLITSARTWFCLYLFEHQMSYGTGRPAILKDDESIWGSRLLLKHPLAIEDDMRLCSTLELMAIRERIHNKLLPLNRPVDDKTFIVLKEADLEFKNWFATWDAAFSQKYEDAAFYRQSLLHQQLLAELFHNASALRGIDGPDDVLHMPAEQKDLAIRSLGIAQHALAICVSSRSYREGLKYAVHYTHATATFTASFILRLGRLFPETTDLDNIQNQVEMLIEVLSEIPARRYAYTLQLMLKKSRKRRAAQSPNVPRASGSAGPPPSHSTHPEPSTKHYQPEPLSPTYDRYAQRDAMHAAHTHHMPHGLHPVNVEAPNLEQIWRGFEGTANEQLPVWLSDQSLGGVTFTQHGMEAFMMPPDYTGIQQIY